MARSIRLVILIKNIYTLLGRKSFLLLVTHFPTNLVYPFTLRVTGIIKSSYLSKCSSGYPTRYCLKYDGATKYQEQLLPKTVLILVYILYLVFHKSVLWHWWNANWICFSIFAPLFLSKQVRTLYTSASTIRYPLL